MAQLVGEMGQYSSLFLRHGDAAARDSSQLHELVRRWVISFVRNV